MAKDPIYAPMPMPPEKYQPKLKVRITNGRNRVAQEIELDLPVHGHIDDIFPLFQMIRKVLEKQDLMPRNDQ